MLPVFVSIPPQKHFVQQIGKELVDVQIMVQAGFNPATYEPKPQQMVALAKTKIYFAIGVPFENVWLKKIAAGNPDMLLILTDQGIKKLAMQPHHHDADPKHHILTKQEENLHRQAGLDPHIWLSPPLVKIQAKNILLGLQKVDPKNAGVYEVNYSDFITNLDKLDAELKRTFAEKQGMQFMVFHPAWGYFAHTYGLKQVPIEIEGKAPKPAQLQELIKHAKEKGSKVIFVQPQFSTKSAKIVARSIGGQVAFANPLAEDWTANIQQIANTFQAALQ